MCPSSSHTNPLPVPSGTSRTFVVKTSLRSVKVSMKTTEGATFSNTSIRLVSEGSRLALAGCKFNPIVVAIEARPDRSRIFLRRLSLAVSSGALETIRCTLEPWDVAHSRCRCWGLWHLAGVVHASAFRKSTARIVAFPRNFICLLALLANWKFLWASSLLCEDIALPENKFQLIYDNMTF
jgi:hypothetical protein